MKRRLTLKAEHLAELTTVEMSAWPAAYAGRAASACW